MRFEVCKSGWAVLEIMGEATGVESRPHDAAEPQPKKTKSAIAKNSAKQPRASSRVLGKASRSVPSNPRIISVK